VDPTVGLLWAFHIHADDEDVLRVQIDREWVGELTQLPSLMFSIEALMTMPI
jgi:hypothetical protein